MAKDPLDLYELARYSNPGGALAGFGTWAGHIGYYEGMRVRLRSLIADATSRGCPIPGDAFEMLLKPVPLFPFL